MTEAALDFYSAKQRRALRSLEHSLFSGTVKVPIVLLAVSGKSSKC